MTATQVPRPDEAAEYCFKYIKQVPADIDVRRVLKSQMSEAGALFASIDEPRSLLRYAPGKWSIREVLSHINDAERVFAFRAFWFARGLRTELPTLDQDVAVQHSAADRRTWASHVEEFRVVRHATLTLLDALDDDAWDRQGMASGHPVTVRALAYICAGHVVHHLQVLRQRYL